MTSKSVRVFRDPVHQNIEFISTAPWDKLAQALIDSPQVQRLRRVRQLGLANLVYHGAEHSRFIHSLGVAHLAKRLYHAAARNSGVPVDERELCTVVAAAILHDTGHPPFSHAVEKTVGVKHETVTVDLLRDDSEVGRILRDFGGEEFLQGVAEHIEGSSDAATVALVNSQLDADRLDYVLRDGYYAGVPNANFDLERIVQLIWRKEDDVCFDERAQFAIEGYFTARYHLYLQLYYHRTVRAAEVMLRSLLKRAKMLAADQASLGNIHRELVTLLTSGSTASSARLTDADFWSAFSQWSSDSPDDVLRDLSSRLLNRRLFRAIDIAHDDVHQFYEEWLPQIREMSKRRGYEPDYYVAVDKASSTPYVVADLDITESVIMLDRQGNLHRLETTSALIRALQRETGNKVRCCIVSEIRDEALALFR